MLVCAIIGIATVLWLLAWAWQGEASNQAEYDYWRRVHAAKRREGRR